MPCYNTVPISIIPPTGQGQGPLVWQNGSQINRLNIPLNPSWLVFDGSKTRWGDGSAQAPIYLPSLQQVQQSTINYSVGLNTSGQLAAYANTTVNPNNALVTATGSTTPRTLANRFADVTNVLDWGADPTGVSDSTIAIQAAVNAAGSGTVFIPSGTYKITSAINVTGGVSIVGEGQASVIQPYNCNGLNFLASNVVGNRQVSNFTILFPTNGQNYTAININLDSTIGNRVTGVTFDNLYLAFCGIGIYARGLWHSTIQNCYINNTFIGIQFDGQSVKNCILNCKIVRGNGITGSGNSKGVSVTQNGINRSEDVVLLSTLIFGFDVGVYIQSVLFCAITDCDIDYCQLYGIQAIVTNGGFTVESCWIATDSASTNVVSGINLLALGSLSRNPISIINNNISCGNSSVSITSGVLIGGNQDSVIVSGNGITGFDYAVYDNGGSNAIISNNILNGTTYGVFLYTVTGTKIDGNYLNAPIAANPASGGATVSQITYGVNKGVQTTCAVGNITMPSGATTVTVSLASLGLNPIKLGNPSFQKCIITFGYNGTFNRGYIWGYTDGTNIICYVTNAVGLSDPAIQFNLQCYN